MRIGVNHPIISPGVQFNRQDHKRCISSMSMIALNHSPACAIRIDLTMSTAC